MAASYIVTFTLGTEVVCSRHKTLKAARKAAAQKAAKSVIKGYRIYKRVC